LTISPRFLVSVGKGARGFPQRRQPEWSTDPSWWHRERRIKPRSISVHTKENT